MSLIFELNRVIFIWCAKFERSYLTRFLSKRDETGAKSSQILLASNVPEIRMCKFRSEDPRPRHFPRRARTKFCMCQWSKIAAETSKISISLTIHRIKSGFWFTQAKSHSGHFSFTFRLRISHGFGYFGLITKIIRIIIISLLIMDPKL